MKNKIILSIFVLLVVAGSAGTSYYFYTKYQAAQQALNNPELAAQDEVQQITNKLGKLIELPQDEEPSVATVLDHEKLKDQQFFTSAQDGDKVVIYTKAMKAILYRPSDNKIIEVAPIQITQPEEGSNNPTGDESAMMDESSMMMEEQTTPTTQEDLPTENIEQQ